MTKRHRVAQGLTAAALAVSLFVTIGVTPADTKSKVPVETFTLENGMSFLLVHKAELTTVNASWVAHVGSSNEYAGITGISHLFEHMMFKGTHVLGTTNIQRDLELIAEQEILQEKIRALYEEQKRRYRLGEIADPFDAEARPPELVTLETKFQALVDEQRSLMVKDEFDKVYTGEGGSNMNAFTTEDLTGYFITVPANKLELWFWMESDRLSGPVFREFYSERDVVHEERRLRTESTPTGKFDELFNAMFWESHPYSWPVVGWPSDLRAISKKEADRYFATYYAPNNLTAVLVGNFDTAQVKKLAKKYFGRIPRGAIDPPPVVTLEMEQLAEKRMRAECDCQPQVEVRYHTVPFEHEDSYALDVLASLLNGRTGRLYKALVLDRQIASSASASQDSKKWAGEFSFSAEAKGTATPEQLEGAWYAELKKIIEDEIPLLELQKVKNQIIASSYRRLESPFFLMLQLLFYDGLGDWNFINIAKDKTLAVTTDDVKRVAKKYLNKENRAVALYTRLAGTQAEEIPAELADLPGPARQAIMAQLKQLKSIEDMAQLEEILASAGQQKQAAPPEFQKAIELMERTIKERLAELSKAQEGGE